MRSDNSKKDTSSCLPKAVPFELSIVWRIPNHRFCIFRNKSAQSTPFKVAKNTNRVYARQYGMFQNEKLRAELC